MDVRSIPMAYVRFYSLRCSEKSQYVFFSCPTCYNAVTTRNIFPKYFGISRNLIKFANEM